MNLRDQIRDSSKRGIEKAVEFVADDEKLFKGFLDIAFSSEYQYSNRAARVVFYSGKVNPEFIISYSSEILENVKIQMNESVRATLISIFDTIALPESDKELAELTSLCFDIMSTKTEAAALKVYTMGVLYRISTLIPELKEELLSTIKYQLEFNSTAFFARGKKYIKMLEKDLTQLNL